MTFHFKRPVPPIRPSFPDATPESHDALSDFLQKLGLGNFQGSLGITPASRGASFDAQNPGPGTPARVPPGGPSSLIDQFGGTLGLKKKKKGVFDKADAFLNSTGGNFLLNLAAQSGFSRTPDSPLGAVGRAGVASQEQQSRNRFIESQIARNQALAESGGNPTAGNVQTTFKGANGNMWITFRNGKVKDTGVPFNNNIKFFEQEDGSVIGVDQSTGQQLGTVISPQQAAAATTRKKQTAAAFDLPKDLAGLDSTISKVDRTIVNVKEAIEQVTPGTTGIRGALTSGIPGTKSKALKNQIKTVQANLGFDTLTSMRAASKTGGALGQVSERELELLISAVESLDPELDNETLTRNLNAVVEHYENYKREIEIMKDKLREQAGQPGESINDNRINEAIQALPEV